MNKFNIINSECRFLQKMLQRIYKILILPYTLVLLYLMFLGFGRTQFDENIVRLRPIFSTIEFAKNSLLWNRLGSLLINIIGNIVMFAPFGFLGWILPKYNDFKTLLIAFLSILVAIEALQYFTRMGVFDIDDIILNSVGVYLGFKLKTFLEGNKDIFTFLNDYQHRKT